MSIQAVIFDMDGVIIDSEALWRQAQIDALAQWGATASVEELRNPDQRQTPRRYCPHLVPLLPA
ncbi:2-deoxyglucose-6-phosphate hydrolase YniC [Klebsiella michiganensis]|uniref:2-deoxyglucose-6-phosphate hydrolase YniC n=1 Tax=Klebsiella michiganensis TaxID=1134687 RepID=A0A7H4PQ03_9ENTR|nr:2-deoxyglucose-6-phosphate hydrolase YniC [Klebsiella michiganensis]